MERLINYINKEEGVERDQIKESFNTTLYTFYENEEEYNDNINDDSQVLKSVKEILDDNSLKVIQKAEKIDSIIRKQIKLGDQWKFKAIKDDNGNIFVALRQTYKSQRPFDLIVNVTTSRLALINTEDKGVFVYDADDKDTWDDDRKNIIDQILKLLKCVRNSSWKANEYSLGNVETDKEINKEETSEEQNNKEQNKEETSENNDNENQKDTQENK